MTEISNEWGGNAIMQQSIQRWTLNLNWSDKKNKTKNRHGCFKIDSMFRTSVHVFFLICHALVAWLELSRAKLYRNDLKGNKNYEFPQGYVEGAFFFYAGWRALLSLLSL